jgi:2'-5' RNA ligase
VRLFVAVRPPEGVLDAVAALARPERPGVRWTTRDQWHVTLRFLGELDDPDPLAAALAAAPLPAAEAAAGPRVAALGSGVVCLPVAGLEALAAAVGEASAGWGRPPEDRPFRGHLTLARVDRRQVRGRTRPRTLAGEALTARFPVTDVRLVRSHLGRSGPRYEDILTRPLPKA